jgi:ribosomal-protein-alanine N-acetyltransferase
LQQIVTQRLTLRPFTRDDADSLYVILSDKNTMSFWPEPFNIEQTRQWIEKAIISYKQNGFGRMAVVLNENVSIIGDCGIMLTETDGKTENDLGYIIHSSHWGNGYGTEAARACLEYGFNNLKLSRLATNMDVNNKASVRIAEKIGMIREKEFYNKKNLGLLTYLYSITKK